MNSSLGKEYFLAPGRKVFDSAAQYPGTQGRVSAWFCWAGLEGLGNYELIHSCGDACRGLWADPGDPTFWHIGPGQYGAERKAKADQKGLWQAETIGSSAEMVMVLWYYGTGGVSGDSSVQPQRLFCLSLSLSIYRLSLSFSNLSLSLYIYTL